MPSSAPLRLVVSREATNDASPPMSSDRPAPPTAAAADKATPVAAGASLAVHAAVLLWLAINGMFGEERAAGAADDLVLIEGIPIELIEAAPVPEAPPSEESAETEPAAEAETPPEPVEDVAEPAETSEPATEPEPAAPTEPEDDPVTEPMPEAAPESLPPPDAETGELAARPETVTIAAEESELPPPEVADEPPEAEEAPPSDIPTPRLKPERTDVADADPPPEPKVERETPKKTPPTPAKPAAPPPSAPSAPSSAARSGGAGGGGVSQTAGSAAASAYRAKVAAQLKRKRFYPNAARRDRLTGSATVSFTLNASGKVTAVRVVRSSGKKILDEAAIEMVRRASPYPPIPPGLGSTITVQAPIAFDLPR